MRIRSLKPELADDAKLARASLPARYTFVLLISKADDDGLVPGAHRQLLGLLYPHNEEVTVTLLLAWLEELVEIGVVRWRVTRDGIPVVELVNWAKHQRIDNKGRNTLRGLLVEVGDVPVVPAPPTPAAENGHSPRLAESRGDSPRLAESRRLDREGDREKEEEGESEGTPRRAARKAPRSPRPAAAAPAWVEPVRARWLLRVGRVSPITVQRELAEPVEVHGEETILAAIDAYAEARIAAGKPLKIEWFAQEIASWVARLAPLVDGDGILTERGRAVMGAAL